MPWFFWLCYQDRPARNPMARTADGVIDGPTKGRFAMAGHKV